MPQDFGSKFVKMDTYKGKPLLVFQLEEGERFPFSFGPAKAKRLIAAIDELGADKVVELLRTLASQAD